MLTIDQRPFKQAVHKLIDEADSSVSSPGDFVEGVQALCEEHEIIIDSGRFGSMVAKLLLANNKNRAHKLVDALDDRGLSAFGAICVWLGKWTIRLALLAGFVALVMWAYDNCKTP